MSWKVDDEQWLAPVEPITQVEVFDELDARVVEQLLGQPTRPLGEPGPPPPPEFEADGAATSYESGKFVVDEVVEASDAEAAEPEPEPEPEVALASIPVLTRPTPVEAAAVLEMPAIPPVVRPAPSVVEPPAIPPLVRPAPSVVEPPAIPPLVRPAPSVEPPAIPPLVRPAPSVEPPAIPPLVRPAPSVEPPAIPSLVRPVPSVEPPADDEAPLSIPSLTRPPETAAAQADFVIPSLRRDDDARAPEAAEAAPLDVELREQTFPIDPAGDSDEVEDVELVEVEDAPVRTGDTVIGPPPSAPPSEPTIVLPSLVAATASVAADVYDDDEGSDVHAEVAAPEPVAGVDSAELEILTEDEDTAVGYPPEEPDAEPEPEGGITPAEIVLPMLAHLESSDEEVALVRDDDEGVAEELEAEAEVELVEAEVEERHPPEPDAPEQRRPPPPTEKRRKAWYDDVFAEHFVFLHPPSWEETARRDAKFIQEVLGLQEGASVLDVGCGDGRHAIELGKLGMRVIGLDNSLAMLLAAAQHKEQAGMDERVSFLHGDMRRPPRDRQFDAVICIGSTFGYFEEDQNRACLEELIARLQPGGRLLLHVFNRDFVAPQLPARSWWQGRRCMVLDEAEMNFFANRLRIHRTVIFDDGRQFEHYMFLRAFTVHDLGKALSQMGMRVVEVSGSRDTRKRFYGSASPEIWIVAEHKS
jgi:SAM-dependent methyltransferase